MPEYIMPEYECPEDDRPLSGAFSGPFFQLCWRAAARVSHRMLSFVLRQNPFRKVCKCSGWLKEHVSRSRDRTAQVGARRARPSIFRRGLGREGAAILSDAAGYFYTHKSRRAHNFYRASWNSDRLRLNLSNVVEHLAIWGRTPPGFGILSRGQFWGAQTRGAPRAHRRAPHHPRLGRHAAAVHGGHL